MLEIWLMRILKMRCVDLIMRYLKNVGDLVDENIENALH